MCCLGKDLSIRSSGIIFISPLHVIPPAQTLEPISELLSITRVLIPFRDSFAAQASPAGPAPMIITS